MSFSMKNFDRDNYTSKDIVYINGETAIKPYFYIRNGLLHVRFKVDKAIVLSPAEEAAVKAEITNHAYEKQDILKKKWSFFADCVGKDIIEDGIKAGEDRMKELSHGYENKSYKL